VPKDKTYKIAVFFPPWYSFLYKTMNALLDIRGMRHHCEFRNFISTDFDQPIELPMGYKPDGVLTSYDDLQFGADWLNDIGVPIVNIFSSVQRNHPSVCTCPKSVAEAVFSHFITLNFKEIGLLSTKGSEHIKKTDDYLEQLALKNNIPFWKESISDGIQIGEWGKLIEQAPTLKERLTGIKRRCGIYATHDVRARLLAEYVTELGIKVPDQIGILGRFDSINARLSTPELSSVVPPTKDIASASIKLLMSLIEGEKEHTEEELHIELPVTEIRARESTVGKKNQDIAILQARNIIREEACKGLTVEVLLQDISIGRSTFEKRYRALCGLSAAQDIRRVRLNKARELLITSHLSIEEVANRVGFNDPRPFVVFFKRETGSTPGKYRKEHASQKES